MIIKCNNSIKAGGVYHFPGQIIDLPESEAKRLVKIKAAEFLPVAGEGPESVGEDPEIGPEDGEQKSDQDFVEELEQVKGVPKALAKSMADAGIDGISGLQKMTAEDLYGLGIKGIGKAKAKTIIDDALEFGDIEEDDESDEADETD